MGRHSQRSDCGFVFHCIHNMGVPQAQNSQSGCSYKYFMTEEKIYPDESCKYQKFSNAPTQLI